MHRNGSNVVNGRYFVDKDPHKTLAHYSSFRKVDTAGLRAQYDAATKMTRGGSDEGIAAGAVPGRGAAALRHGRERRQRQRDRSVAIASS